jgi:DNA-binding response OmpR family regulator
MNNRVKETHMGRARILIAEDDTSILEAIRLILEDEGYEVATTANGKAIQDLKEDLPDLLLLDIWLAGMDGIRICQQLKSQELTKQLPVILCSANKDTEELTRVCGADDFIAKPFELDDLLAKVAKHTAVVVQG